MRLHGLGGIAWAREFEAWRSGSRLGDSECLHSGRRAIGQTAARLTRRVYSIEALGSSYRQGVETEWDVEVLSSARHFPSAARGAASSSEAGRSTITSRAGPINRVSATM